MHGFASSAWQTGPAAIGHVLLAASEVPGNRQGSWDQRIVGVPSPQGAYSEAAPVSEGYAGGVT